MDTEQVLSPDKLCVEIDGLSGRRYRAQDGVFNMTPGDAAATIKYGGTRRGFSIPQSVKGYWCQSCSFLGLYKVCSRCGGEAIREGR